MTGPKSAQATVVDNGEDLRVVVKTSDLGLKTNTFSWSAIVQGGVPGNASGTGTIDQMPDTGFMNYTLQ